MSREEEDIRKILEAKTYIKRVLHSHREKLEYIRTHRPTNSDLVLNLANNIALTNGAPKNWVEGAPLFKSHAPAPQFEYMTSGALNHYNTRYNAANLSAKLTAQNNGSDKAAAQCDGTDKLKQTVENLKSLLSKRKSGEIETNDQVKEDVSFANEIFNRTMATSNKRTLVFKYDDSDDDSDS